MLFENILNKLTSVTIGMDTKNGISIVNTITFFPPTSVWFALYDLLRKCSQSGKRFFTPKTKSCSSSTNFCTNPDGEVIGISSNKVSVVITINEMLAIINRHSRVDFFVEEITTNILEPMSYHEFPENVLVAMFFFESEEY